MTSVKAFGILIAAQGGRVPIAGIADIGKGRTSPLINADDADLRKANGSKTYANLGCLGYQGRGWGLPLALAGLLRGLLFRLDAWAGRNLCAQVGIKLQGFQDRPRDAIVDFAGVGELYRIANHHFQGSLREMQAALRGESGDGGIQGTLDVAALQFHFVAIL